MDPKAAENPLQGAETDLPSKSQRKREARVLFELSRDLVAMSRRQLESLPIEADLLREIGMAQSIRSHVARKRQVQFIAKKMRSRDVGAIQEALAALRDEARQVTVRHHRVESWRDHLLESGDSALEPLIDGRDRSVIPPLRTLLRNAHKEAAAGKPPAAARKLFKLLREMDAEAALPPVPVER